MIKTVIFDIDNTLYSYDDAHAVAFSLLKKYAEQELGMSQEEFEDAHCDMYKELTGYMGDCAGIHNRMIRYTNILERKGLPLYPHAMKMYDLYWDTLIDNMVPADGAGELMQELKRRNIRIGIGSDMTEVVQIRKLEKLGLLQYIDFVVVSEETGEEKPSARFFARCLEKAGCEKEECLFIGDNMKKDVLGAEKFGMKSILYNYPCNDNISSVMKTDTLMGLIDFLDI